MGRHIGDKEVESTYYAQIGSAGLQHSLEKPFVESSRAQLLLEFGAVLSLLTPPPARIVDFGCGTGWTTDFLARSGYHATGVDLSPEAIAAASETNASENARFVLHDYETPLEESGTYDLALFFDALHHCTDAHAALRTAAVALRPGGICVVMEPGHGHSTSPTSLEARERFGVTERDMPPELVLTTAREAGFRDGEIYPFPADAQRLLFSPPGPSRRGPRRLLDTRVGRWLLMVRAVDFNARRSGLVRLVR